MSRINELLKNNILKIMYIFLISMPFLDIITSLSIHIFENSFVIVFKLIVMLILIYYLIFISKSKYKKVSIIYLVILFMYIVLYFTSIIHFKDVNALPYELKNLFRAFYLPINFVCLFNIYQDNKLNITKKELVVVLFIYIILLFIPTITKTGFNSYADSKEGSLGWFYSTNEIGGILSILLPFGISYLLNIKNLLLKVMIFVISMYTYFSLGTKVPILSLIIVISLLLLKYIIYLFKKRETIKILIISVISIISLLSFIYIIPKTTFYKNIIIHLEFLKINSIEDMIDVDAIDDFIFSERITFYKNTLENYSNAELSQKLIGIGYIENYGKDNINLKMIEMDYYDIFFRHGIIGFTIYFVPFIFIIILSFKKLKLNNELYNIYISIILILLLSLFSGHILVAPSVSIFVIYIILLFLRKIEVVR